MSPIVDAPLHPSLPLLGDSLNYIRDADGFLRGLQSRYGRAVRTRSFGFESLMLFGPEANQFVLQNRDEVFANAAWSRLIGPFFPRGLMLLDFDEHRLHRRIMQAAFSREALAGYCSAMQPRIARDLLRWPRDGRVQVFDLLKKLTLNIGSEVFAGEAPGPEAEALNRAFLDTVQAATSIVRYDLPGTRWRAGLRGRRLLESHFGRALAARRAMPGSDLFSRLCTARAEDGALFSDADVINHMIFVLMAAHDTSTITLSNLLYQLARHPQWQERLRAESRALGDGPLSLDDLDRLEGAGLAMKEALRLCAPVPSLPRTALRETSFDGIRIPAGLMVAVSPWVTHHLAEYWTKPFAFDPERFNAQRAEDRQHPFLWLPFGGGAHKCIGLHFGQMEVKAILHALLLRYRFSVPRDYVMPQDFTSLPIPRDRLPMRIEALAA